MKSDLIDLEVRLYHQTDKAWLVSTDDENRFWIPMSRAELDGKILTLPRSLAEEKGMV